MTQLTGQFDTANGSKYLQQLCKHFAHKIEVTFSETKGTIRFEFGTAHVAADGVGLTVRFDLDSPDTEDRARMVIDKHLARFAFREGFEHMVWQAAA